MPWFEGLQRFSRRRVMSAGAESAGKRHLRTEGRDEPAGSMQATKWGLRCLTGEGVVLRSPCAVGLFRVGVAVAMKDEDSWRGNGRRRS
jgi:hypothetical protein